MTEKFYQKFIEPKKKKISKPVKPKQINKHEKNIFEKKPAGDSEIKPVSLFSAETISKDAVNILNNFDEIVQGIKPLNSRQLQQLPENIRNLSHLLTDNRSERRLGYMNDNIQLSSYIRYYTWWNLVRITRLFSNLPEACFPSKDGVCLDLGSGPLTVVTALWLARPELRKLRLTWYCLDVSANSMGAGEDIYLSIVARSGEDPWNIVRVKGSFGTEIRQKADFITSANMFNELDQSGEMPPEYQTKKYFSQLKVYSAPHTKFLLIEPGIPKSARTLSLLRERFVNDGKFILAPCPHQGECPMNGFKAYTGSKNKWCNFAFSTEDAPPKLLKLSENAKLPKERATLSFISITSIADEDSTKNQKYENCKTEVKCRVTSDAFRLPGNFTGHYACTKLGLVLLKGHLKVSSGDSICVKIKAPDSLRKDEKSGATIIDL